MGRLTRVTGEEAGSQGAVMGDQGAPCHQGEVGGKCGPPLPPPLVWSRPFHDRVPSHQQGTRGRDQSWEDRSPNPYWTYGAGGSP